MALLAGSVAATAVVGSAPRTAISQDDATWRAAVQAHRPALLAAMATIDPRWAPGGTRDPEAELNDFVETCSSIAQGTSGDQLVQLTMQRFSDASGQVNDTQALQLIDLSRQYVCPPQATGAAPVVAGYLTPEQRAYYAYMWHMADAARRLAPRVPPIQIYTVPPPPRPSPQVGRFWPPMPNAFTTLPGRAQAFRGSGFPAMPWPQQRAPQFGYNAPLPYGGGGFPYGYGGGGSGFGNCPPFGGPFLRGTPGYSPQRDADRDGIACE